MAYEEVSEADSEMKGNEDEDSEEHDGPTMIERLEQEGVSMKDIEKLKEAGYNTVESVTF